jgi:Holliday junction DNA helicase RuvA
LIHHLEGILEEKLPGRVVVDVEGVGFEVHVPDATWREAGVPGGRLRVLTHLVVREDSWTLYGFRREDERGLFRLLLEVQGVGPRVALAVLSGLPADRLRRAIGEGDVATLTTVPGVGKKTAQRIVVDLKDKLAAFAEERDAGAASPAGEGDDAVDALVALGYPRHVAREAVRTARAGRTGPEAPLEEVVRDALRRL